METLGRYEIRGELGRGNMGVVYRGYDPVLDRIVALKTVALPDALPREDREKFLERFLLEARIAARLIHPNIVIIHDAATDEGTGVPFIAMEYVEGETLNDRLRTVGRFPWRQAVEIVVPLADALSRAHQEGIVHRDIKPANVLLTRSGIPKIADFGIAKLPRAHLTQTGVVLGTPYFMSPEQIRGEDLDGRSDVFSLGALLYTLLAGSPPFRGSEIASITSQVLFKDPPPPSEIAAGVPSDVDHVVARALAKSVDSRYGSAAEFRDDLISVREGKGLRDVSDLAAETAAQSIAATSRPVATPTPAEAKAPESRKADTGRVWRRVLPTWPWRIGAAVISLALMAGLVVFLFSRPLTFDVRHDHTVGFCTGVLRLDGWGVEFDSDEHGRMQWRFDQIRRIERSDEWHLLVETREDQMLGLLKVRRYNFQLLDAPLEEDDWNQYRSLFE